MNRSQKLALASIVWVKRDNALEDGRRLLECPLFYQAGSVGVQCTRL
jgi:hypothetical protein